ncbi:nuclear transport factor 2 family protein [uncultured Aquimarina sp.]|uniref:nuclear transport factor 2 family protein n=1 Tax=uncultured Aquimarina sp. TaxID=575652 RepID=UPI0026030B24|nr:nuclear transport factor 2 family protein [uncultured Aquimarina sp.]
MTRFFISVFMFFTCIMIGQVNSLEIQKLIDQTVWEPFQKAYEAMDAVSLNAIYADEVLRVTPEGIDTKNAFKDKNIERLKASKESNTKIKLDFWFDSRHTNEDTSYEVGFYKIGITTDDKTQYIYGQFHIVLKKINGIWKITQDWDTTTINGESITEKDFNKK